MREARGGRVRVAIDASELASAKPEEPRPSGGEEAPAEQEGAPPEAAAPERTVIDELATFLSERLGVEVLISGSELILEVEGRAARRRVKQLLKKFLYKHGLDEEFRVISLGEEGFKIKYRRFPRIRPPRWV